jgi:predicted house-cleaning noncanonical NTP pyrophosphatase (MazG superfamily)
MAEKAYNKLVRDGIPGVIRANGQTPITRILNNQEYNQSLLHKIEEETVELIEAKDPEEILNESADVMELLLANLALHNLTQADLEAYRKQKLAEKGGFQRRIFLEKVIGKSD